MSPDHEKSYAQEKLNSIRTLKLSSNDILIAFEPRKFQCAETFWNDMLLYGTTIFFVEISGKYFIDLQTQIY